MQLRDGVTKVEFSTFESAALEAWKKDGLSAEALGEALIKVRDACAEHGDFTRWMKAHKVDRNRANYCIRLAEGKVAAAQKKAKANKPAEPDLCYVVPLPVRIDFGYIAFARNVDANKLATEVLGSFVKDHVAEVKEGKAL